MSYYVINRGALTAGVATPVGKLPAGCWEKMGGSGATHIYIYIYIYIHIHTCIYIYVYMYD